MSIERTIIISIWVFGALLLVLFVPRNKIREAITAFLFCQAIVWLIVLLHVRMGQIRFPVREFPSATDLSFTLNYFLWPVISAFYYIHEPKNGFVLRALYLLVYVVGTTLLHLAMAHYTQLIDYVKLKWYVGFMFPLFFFLATRFYCNWFFKDSSLVRSDRKAAD
jgi:hypothetical protein